MKTTQINELEPDVQIERDGNKAWLVFHVVPLLDGETEKRLLPAITVRRRVTNEAATTLETCFRSTQRRELGSFALAF